MLQLLYIPLYIFYTAAFLQLIYRAKFFDIGGTDKKHLALFFLLKVTGGLVLTLIYTYYYTDPTKADIYRYYTDSKIVSSLLFSHPMAWLKVMFSFNPLGPDTFNYLHDTLYISHPVKDFITSNTLLIKIISLLNYFSFYDIYIDTLLLNCIMFCALVLLFKALVTYFEGFPQMLYWPFFLLPSVVFWSSGLLKEALLFTGISLYLSQWLTLAEDSTGKKLAIAAIGFLTVGLTKVYVAILLLVCTVFLPCRKLGFAKTTFGIRALAAIFICLVGWYYCSHYPVCKIIAEKRNEFITLSIAEHSSSSLDTAVVTPDCRHISGLFPSAMVNAVLRPFIWDKGNSLQMLFAIENLVFIMLMLLLIIFYFKWPESNNVWLVLFCFLFAMLNYLGIGITVPVLGAIVHYRVVAMPFLLLSVLLITDLDKLKLHLSRLSSH